LRSVGSARKNRPALRCGNFGLAGGVAEVSAFHRIISIKTLFVNLKVLFLAEKAIFNVVTLVTRDIPESPQGKISCAALRNPRAFRELRPTLVLRKTGWCYISRQNTIIITLEERKTIKLISFFSSIFFLFYKYSIHQQNAELAAATSFLCFCKFLNVVTQMLKQSF
jgi:hypothetical protein